MIETLEKKISKIVEGFFSVKKVIVVYLLLHM